MAYQEKGILHKAQKRRSPVQNARLRTSQKL